MSRAALLLTGLVMAFVPALGGTSATATSPMPPQLPTAQEMAALQAQLSAKLDAVREAQAKLDAAVREYEAAQDHLTKIVGEINVAEARLGVLQADLKRAHDGLNSRAASSYRFNGLTMLEFVLDSGSFDEFTNSLRMIKSVIKADSTSLKTVQNLKTEAEQVRASLETSKTNQQAAISALDKKQDEIDRSLRAAGREYEAIKAEVEKRKSGFAFPVKAPYSYTDSWGAPRMEGSKYYHRHEGTDIFALSGTPVVAVVDGVIENLGNASLGGVKLWVRSPGDRWSYYYAHLTGYAAGIANGVKVKKGQVLGYVGNTGNARGTPPHLHFETHVPSGAPTNPFPILRRVDPLAK